ncbi:MAG: hypothetical protein WA021_05025 [Minisyncoccia bacterium]
MAQLLPFKQRQPTGATIELHIEDDPPRPAGAQMIIFPGVKRESLEDTHWRRKTSSPRKKAKRDWLELLV